jgi:hypothetical protein
MAFLAFRLTDVISRPRFVISADDERLISQETNELAELIFAQSVPLQGVKGYLSIFRNLTDSQPLADAVLDRLAERDLAAHGASATPLPIAALPAGKPILDVP